MAGLTVEINAISSVHALDGQSYKKHKDAIANFNKNYEELKAKVDGAGDRFTELGTSIKAKEKRLGEIRALRTHIINYAKTRDVYVAYRKSGYCKKYYESHAQEIILHKAAKDAFEEMHVDKLPTVKSLNQEFNEILIAKKQEYDEYHRLKNVLRYI